MKLTVLSEAVVREIITVELAFEAVGEALKSVATRHASIMPVVLAEGGPGGAMFGVKTATHLSAGLLGLKVGSYFPENHARGIPNHGSTTLLLDGETGLPRAIVSAGYLNGLRTAAANAVAVDRLAREDASVLGVIGAGHQAEFEVRAVAARRALRQVKVWSRTPTSAADLCQRLGDLDLEVTAVDQARAAVEGSDIVTTVTPARAILVEAGWVGPGTHISAMGSDTDGKQELDPRLMERATAFADLPAQSVRIGEFQHAAAAQLLTADDITPLGAVLLGQHPGRTTPDEITVFDSSGVAPQDLHVAAAVLREATARGRASIIDF
ncbi:MAG: ornithine cyclodeaminase family protein [Myxococcota bacterium]